MISVNIVTQILLANGAVTAIVGDKVHPLEAPQDMAFPHIVVHLVSEPEEDMLDGSSQLRDGRVSCETRTTDIDQLSILGEAVIDAMRDKLELHIAGAIVTTRKAATDETDAARQTGPSGGRSVYRRITDFYVFWRKA